MTDAVPWFATPRCYDRATVGHEVVEVMRRLGFTAMPWQSDMFDVMFEVDELGRLFYRECRVTVPRQSGKTTTTLARQVHRMLRSEALGWGPRPVGAYTAQTAQDARQKLTLEWKPIIESSEVQSEVTKMVIGNGQERIDWQGGGRMKVFPPTQTGAHGQTIDAADLDEVFAYVDNRAEQGVRPAQITRLSPQLVIQSTAGTLDSLYLNDKVEDGRARVEANDDGRVFYLEYSAGPDNDIHDESQWHLWMPALGQTISIEAIRIEHQTITEDEFARAYGNVMTGSVKQIIPAKEWAEAFALKTKREGKCWMAVDVAPGLSGKGRSASISVASYRGAEIHVEVIEHGPGVKWVADKLYERTREISTQCVLVDPIGPAGQILPDLRAKSAANIEEVDTQTMVNACGRFHQAVMDGTVRHRGQEMLEKAVSGAARRTLNDGWAFKRASSSTDISPLVSCVLAHWGAVLSPETGPIKIFTYKAAAAR